MVTLSLHIIEKTVPCVDAGKWWAHRLNEQLDFVLVLSERKIKYW